MKKKPLLPLSAAAEQLLPAPDESMKCSVFTTSLGVNPAGTAISAVWVVVVDTPLTWPKPVFRHEHLRGLDSTGLDGVGRPVRVLASNPRTGHELSAFAYRRSPEGTVAARLSLAGRSAAQAVAALTAGDDPRMTPSAHELEPRAILVCTQGSHDVCCGAEGSRLAKKVENDPRLGDVPVFRVSHTGGHRFAPTAMTFPDGRMWAYADVDLLAAAMNRTGTPADLADRCRGSWEAPDPRTMAAEVAAWAQGDWNSAPSNFAELDDDVIRVSRGSAHHDVRVTVARDIPSIRCRAAGGLPAKPGVEFAAEVVGNSHPG
ncbi:MAG: sucrase ferredoxin [Acidimicrobiales bacterium]